MASIDLRGDVKEFQRFLDGNRMSTNLKREIKRATLRSALFLVKRVQRQILDRKFDDIGSLTQAVRTNEIPLLDRKNLFNAIDSLLLNQFAVEVGIVRNAGSTGSKFGRAKSQINIKDLVELMEEGYVITVTKKMLRAIVATLNDKNNKSSKSPALQRVSKLVVGTTFAVPPRKVLSSIFEDPGIEKVIQENYRKGLEAAFKAQGAKDGEHRDR